MINNFEDLKKEYFNYKHIKTEKEALEAVKQNGDALRYVKIIKNEPVEMTVAEISEKLGYDVKIVK